MNLVRKYLYFTDWLNAKFAWIVAFLIVPMLCIMIWEIVLRYFFNAPSLWAYEISLFLYGGYIALGGAYTHLTGGHVNVDIIWVRLSPRRRALLDILTSGFAFLFRRAVLGLAEHHHQCVGDRRNHDDALGTNLLSVAHHTAGGVLSVPDAGRRQTDPRYRNPYPGRRYLSRAETLI